MIVSALIGEMRREASDLPEKHKDVRAGDGLSTVYKTKYAPILESSFKLYVNNALQAASGYTVDLDTGDIDLQGPTSNEVRVQYQSVQHRDQHWLEFIQSSIRAFGDKFYRATIRDASAMSISANVQVYDCPSTCIRATEILESDDFTSGGNYRQLNTNVRYDRRSNKIILGNKPTTANFVELSYLKRLSVPTATSDTLDVEENWIEMVKLKSIAKHARAYAYQIAKDGNVSVEEGHLQMRDLRALANDSEILFEDLKKKNKPVMPNSTIPFEIDGGGTV
jgi:hypothetical protein